MARCNGGACHCGGGCKTWDLERFYHLQREADELDELADLVNIVQQRAEQVEQLAEGVKALSALVGMGPSSGVPSRFMPNDELDRLVKSLEAERAAICSRVCQLDPTSPECRACLAAPADELEGFRR